MTKEIDILSHELVPKHELLAKKEKEILLDKLKASVKDLPKILSDDNGIRNLDANKGDVIKITRESQTAGLTFYYRAVV